jgi:hypothetical protein
MIISATVFTTTIAADITTDMPENLLQKYQLLYQLQIRLVEITNTA